MVVKLSSIRTTSAAPLATLVPAMPIAVPMSAILSAAASFTPSPVMAATWPWRCSVSTIATLSVGWARAHVTVWPTISLMRASSASSMLVIGLPFSGVPRTGDSVGCFGSRCRSAHSLVLARACESDASPLMIEMLREMAIAVAFWSPVIITTDTPAFCTSSTDSLTPSRGGSLRPIIAVKVSG